MLPRVFNTVWLLDSTKYPKFPVDWDLKKSWRKPIELQYYKCENYWTMHAPITDDNPEKIALLDGEPKNNLSQKGLSMIIISDKTLPSFLALPVITVYVAFVLALAKLLRSVLIP